MARSKKKPQPPPAWLVEGCMVDYHSVIGEPATQHNMRVRFNPSQMPSGQWVVWLEGKAGCVAVEALTLAVPLLTKPDKPQLRVWWIPQVPMKPFRVSVADLDSAKLLLRTLADYDQFQYDNKIKPDYCNTGGLEVLEDGKWVEWNNDSGDDIDEVMRLERAP